MTYYVLVHHPAIPPWVLNLDGHLSVAAADRAMLWQRQFNPDTQFSLCVVRDGQLVEYVGGSVLFPVQGPYTDEVWAAFKEKIK